MKTYEYKGKKYRKVESKCSCFGCDFRDNITGICLAPMPSELGADCMEDTAQNYQFREIKPTVAKLSTDELRKELIDYSNWVVICDGEVRNLETAREVVDHYLKSRPDSKAVTDEMIEKWVNKNVEVKCHTATEEESEMVEETTSWMRLGAKIGAKAMRDNKIK
jgi:hypothetical protein